MNSFMYFHVLTYYYCSYFMNRTTSIPITYIREVISFLQPLCPFSTNESRIVVDKLGRYRFGYFDYRRLKHRGRGESR